MVRGVSRAAVLRHRGPNGKRHFAKHHGTHPREADIFPHPQQTAYAKVLGLRDTAYTIGRVTWLLLLLLCGCEPPPLRPMPPELDPASSAAPEPSYRPSDNPLLHEVGEAVPSSKSDEHEHHHHHHHHDGVGDAGGGGR
jgi:hypothetical protein